MMRFSRMLLCLCGALTAVESACSQDVVVSEIMFHPLQPVFGPEPVGEEFIELFNRATHAVNLYGWRFDRGITFSFTNVGANFALGPGACLTVAANVDAFLARYPDVTNVVGDWQGTLGNNREELRLVDAAGNTIDTVHYASEGDWAVRQRGPLDLNHRGWRWYAAADGHGLSLQLRNPDLDNDNGQNWVATNATPGAANLTFTSDVPPLIAGVAHSPVVPKSTQSVAVTARLSDESPATVTATVSYRVDSATPPPFSEAPMVDDGLHGDGAAGDGIFGAIIMAQPHLAVVEFFVRAVDGARNTNFWPAPPIPAIDETNLPSRTPCALYQVDDLTYSGTQPVYRLIMTESDRAELASIPCTADQNSNAEVNGTFISVDAAGAEFRYRCGFRNRGHHSRCTTPPNYRVNFPGDQPWKGQRVLNLNSERSYLQVLGSVLAKQCGLAGFDSRAVQVRVNAANLADAGPDMYGAYAANEVYNNTWAERHVPFDADGNLYRVVREPPPSDFSWRGDDPAAYTNTYSKASQASENDWADLIGLHRIVGASDQFTTENVRRVVNVEQWMAHLALMALFADAGTCLNTGFNDDYCLYRGVGDSRFILLYYDLGSILGVLDPDLGFTTTNQDIFNSTTVCWECGSGNMMSRFIHWPDFEPIYYSSLQRLLDTTFAETNFNALIEQTFATFPQTTALTTMIGTTKNWMNGRRAYVQSAITGHVPPATNNPTAALAGEPRSPTPLTSATLSVGGAGITHYRHRLNNGAWSTERPVSAAIELTGLPHGSTNTVYVVGRNFGGIYQSTNAPTLSRTWVVRTNMPAVRLNEVLARNVAAFDHHGTFPDVIELYNEGQVPVDLAGLRLADDPANPNQFTFPANTLLTTDACLIVFANDPDGTPGLHLGFGLSQDGDGIYLFDRITEGGALLDSVVFGLQLPDQSIGRLPRSGAWTLTTPTLGSTNLPRSLGEPATLKINEWLAAGAPPFTDDFVELYNPDSRPIPLGGLYLSDEPAGAPALHRIADLSFIDGRGHRSFLADGNPAAGSNHLNFQLSSELGEISLKAPDLATLDQVSYPPQRLGISQGRCPDGSARITSLTLPTPGYVNFCPSVPTAELVPFVQLTSVWKYNRNGADLGTNWRRVDFDDSVWPSGLPLLGRLRDSPTAYVPEMIFTPINTNAAIPYYFRAHFTIAPEARYNSLQISNVIDDGAVFYVNGTEVGRYNMPGGTVDGSTPAQASVTDAAWRGPIPVPTNLVHAGDNVVAVEVHQISALSEDVMFGLRLDGVIAAIPQSAGVVINEILANNATIAEADGTTADWVEIFNPSTNTVDLGDTSLSDSTGEPRRWVFPSPTLVAPRSFLVVRCDPAAPPSTTNTGFGLKTTGDSVYLFNSPAYGSNIIDWVNFGLQTPDFSVGRVPDGRTNWVLCVPTTAASNHAASLGSPANLKINEWMALPMSGDDWFELYNPDPQPVALGGLWLSDDLGSAAERMKTRIPALSFLGCLTNAFQRFHADKNIAAGADHVDFRLNGTGGDSLGVSFADGGLINGVNFGAQSPGISEGPLPDGQVNRMRFAASASPGEANYLVLPRVAINEVLAHTELPLEDAVELRNLTGDPVPIGGWYLSDAKLNFRKFLIPPGTILPPHGFSVFYECQFHNLETPATAFALSSVSGDQVYLSEATNGQLTGWRAEVDFGPSENGVSFGRYETSSGVDFVAMSALSLGTSVTAQSPTNQLGLFRTGLGGPNPYPKVGPIIISEIMYHPPDEVVGGIPYDNVIEEFIELRNITSENVPLFDAAHPTNGWRLRDAVHFQFDASHSVAAGGHLLVVSFDPTTNPTALMAFRSRYGTNCMVAGPYLGKLDNSDESVELVKPGLPQPDGSVAWVLVERVAYQDRFPWPTEADGQGLSLQRVSDFGYANDPTNWLAAAPTPEPPDLPDRDGDGMSDAWETAHGFDPNDPADAGQDADSDGLTNLQEYLCGTDPRDTHSYLRVECCGVSGGEAILRFNAVAGRTYTVLCREAAEGGAWTPLVHQEAQPITQIVTVLDPTAQGSHRRFYRLVTPARP